MAVVTIPWTTGTGNITLTFQGHGNGTVLVESDANDLTTARSQTITIKTVDNSIARSVVINQGGKTTTPNFILSDGKYLKLSDGEYFNVKE